MQTKYSFGDIVYFLMNNKIKSGKVFGIQFVEIDRIYIGKRMSIVAESIRSALGKTKEVYYVDYGDDETLIDAKELFSSKEELLSYIQD